MLVRGKKYGGRRFCALATLASLVPGCGDFGALLGASGPRTTLGLTPIPGSPAFQESAENNLFERADVVRVGTDPKIIAGSISTVGDVDIFDMGPAQAGDRLVVRMTTDASLNAAIALFDDTGTSILINDHRNVYLGVREPFIDYVFRRPSQSCYVAVAATPGNPSFGDYVLSASRFANVTPPPLRPDAILLVFSGAEAVAIGTRSPIDVPAFNAADIDAGYRNQTERMVRGVVSLVREDFAGLDVTIFSTSEGAQFDGEMTRVFFGAHDPGLLGVAEGVDEFNATRAQNAIVFTNTFQVFSQLNPSVEQMAQAIANVASHEIGHLLGLVHTADPNGIMDVTASLNQLLTDQHFRHEPIYSMVFPVGFQNSAQYLLDAIGGNAELVRLQGALKELERPRQRSVDVGPPARGHAIFSSCGLEDHAAGAEHRQPPRPAVSE